MRHNLLTEMRCFQCQWQGWSKKNAVVEIKMDGEARTYTHPTHLRHDRCKALKEILEDKNVSQCSALYSLATPCRCGHPTTMP